MDELCEFLRSPGFQDAHDPATSKRFSIRFNPAESPSADARMNQNALVVQASRKPVRYSARLHAPRLGNGDSAERFECHA